MKKALLDAFDEEGVGEISFKAWVSVDYTTLETITLSTDMLVDCLTENLPKLRKHDFIVKDQAYFFGGVAVTIEGWRSDCAMRCLRELFLHHSGCSSGVPLEQDQATMHPFVAYFNGKCKRQNPEEGICSLNIVIISDSLLHNAVSVHCFIKKLLMFLNNSIDVTKVFYMYFSDRVYIYILCVGSQL